MSTHPFRTPLLILTLCCVEYPSIPHTVAHPHSVLCRVPIHSAHRCSSSLCVVSSTHPFRTPLLILTLCCVEYPSIPHTVAHPHSVLCQVPIHSAHRCSSSLCVVSSTHPFRTPLLILTLCCVEYPSIPHTVAHPHSVLCRVPIHSAHRCSSSLCVVSSTHPFRTPLLILTLCCVEYPSIPHTIAHPHSVLCRVPIHSAHRCSSSLCVVSSTHPFRTPLLILTLCCVYIIVKPLN